MHFSLDLLECLETFGIVGMLEFQHFHPDYMELHQSKSRKFKASLHTCLIELGHKNRKQTKRNLSLGLHMRGRWLHVIMLCGLLACLCKCL